MIINYGKEVTFISKVVRDSFGVFSITFLRQHSGYKNFVWPDLI